VAEKPNLTGKEAQRTFWYTPTHIKRGKKNSLRFFGVI